MAMKAAHSEDNADKNITGSTRQHIVSRLRKAVQIAQQVVDILAETDASGAHDTDILEAKAYRYALAGAEEFEKQSEGIKASNASPQRWNTCLTNFSAARVIYSSLLKATKKDLFKEVLAATTDPSIRYAAYQSRIPRTVGVPAISRKFFPKEEAALVKAVQTLDPAALEEEDVASSREFLVLRSEHSLTTCRHPDHLARSQSEHCRRRHRTSACVGRCCFCRLGPVQREHDVVQRPRQCVRRYSDCESRRRGRYSSGY
jgi:signal recognition particle subunit SRP68